MGVQHLRVVVRDPLLAYVMNNAQAKTQGLGYLVGPAIGSSLWRLTHRRLLTQIEARDREFHKHIVKNRVDPTAQSATNPVPDFYGWWNYLSLSSYSN